MENIPKIKEINIFGYEYNFENYLSDLKSYNSNQNNIFNKEEKSKRYNQKIDILLSEKSERIKILRGIFFNETKDWELFRILSILEFYQPELCYVYYKVGEKYGETDNTIVKLENKLINKLFIYHNNQNVFIKTFIDEQMEFLDETEINKIVNIYFEKRLKKSEVKTTDYNYFKTNSDLITKTELNTEKHKFWTQKDYDRERGINVDAWDYGDNFQKMLECSREEEREAKRNPYSDGGGGQEWSDYSEIN